MISSTSSTLLERLTGLTGHGRQAFLQSLSQHARLITIDTPLEAGALVVERFTGHEAMSELFRFEVDCLATSTHYELKTLVGEEATLRLQLADGHTRSFHGIVAAVEQLGSDGAQARYKLILAPWLYSLTLRRDSYVFQDKSVLEIIEEVLKDYPTANYRFDIKTSLPKRSIAIQYRESDYDFITRILSEEGLNFFFAHDDDHAGSKAVSGGKASNIQSSEYKAAQAKHQFVVFEDNDTLRAGRQKSIRFHRAAATESSDSITHFTRRHEVQANAVTLGSWDYKKLLATSLENSTQTVLESVPKLEIYEGLGAYRYTDDTEGARITRARAESLEFIGHTVHGESSVRALEVGTWFSLSGYPDSTLLSGLEQANREFAVLSIEHAGANNFPSGVADFSEQVRVEPGTYRNKFTCIPRDIPIRPRYWFPKPTAPGAQVAVVVGVTGEEITTERDHRIKIQFPWQRGSNANLGQLDHPATSNAPGNESAGTWVRVAEPSAGANWGGHFIPRIGQEVLVDFIASDIDRPVVIGQLYNGSDLPAIHGADNHFGALTGIHSKEYAANGFNRWVIDDTAAQLRQTVLSTYAASQLNIGYLIRQNGNVRGPYRGIGFEFASDAWASVRAKRGIFISTTQTSCGGSTQLDTQAAQTKLKAAEDLAKALSDGAHQHQALPISTPSGLEQLVKTISNTETADGHVAPAFGAPAAVLDSAAGISVATPASMIMQAGQDVTMTTASAMRVTGGQAVSVAVAKTASLFTHSNGAKVVAGTGPVSMRAHTGPMDVIADKAMTVTSSNGGIRIQAKQEILLSAGGGYIKLAGENIDIHCPSLVSVKGVTHDFLGAGSAATELPDLPTDAMQLQTMELPSVRVHMMDTEGNVPTGEAISLKLSNGNKQKLITDGSGKFELKKVSLDFAADSSQPTRKAENVEKGDKE